jgi:hypothetical protein
MFGASLSVTSGDPPESLRPLSRIAIRSAVEADLSRTTLPRIIMLCLYQYITVEVSGGRDLKVVACDDAYEIDRCRWWLDQERAQRPQRRRFSQDALNACGSAMIGNRGYSNRFH